MPQQLIADTAALATGHPLGAAAGLNILRDGGNAIDAAVAATLALCVVIPGSVGLGGYGGSAVIYCADRSDPTTTDSGRIVAVDFDSCAPLAFREGLVTADLQSNHFGPRAVTVPAVVAGLDLILSEFGTKSWREVSQPAIRLAEEGFEFDTEHERHFLRCAARFDSKSLNSLFPNGLAPKVGERWRQRDLARLLHGLCDDGPAAFYHGEIAAQIVEYLRERDGILTEEDFRSYSPEVTKPVSLPFRGFELYTPLPPSGGVTSLSLVQTMEQFLDEEGNSGNNRQSAESIVPRSPRYYHVLGEAMKLSWRERHQYLGDPAFVRYPFDSLLTDQAAQARAQIIRTGDIQRGEDKISDSQHTSNVIAADAKGNLISLTATQGWMYGSHLVVAGLGLVLNHGMSRFDYSPGHPNAPAPGKRMQHNMAPMIALKSGQPAFAYGLPGGPKIVSVTAQLVLDTIAFQDSPASAIAVPRVHTQGDEPVLVSQHLPDHIIAELETLGHSVRREEDMGGPVNVLTIDPHTRKIDIASGESTGAVAGF
jgi:gamma-glutamyltranspeptidase/glutathione hydrolase